MKLSELAELPPGTPLITSTGSHATFAALSRESYGMRVIVNMCGGGAIMLSPREVRRLREGERFHPGGLLRWEEHFPGFWQDHLRRRTLSLRPDGWAFTSHRSDYSYRHRCEHEIIKGQFATVEEAKAWAQDYVDGLVQP